MFRKEKIILNLTIVLCVDKNLKKNERLKYNFTGKN